MLNPHQAKRFAGEDKPAVATVNRELHDLRRAYKLAAASDLPKVGGIRCSISTEEENASLEFFTMEQEGKIRAAASAEHYEWRTSVELAYGLGWHRGELLGLRGGDFDLLAGTVRIETSKNGRPREGVLTDNLKRIIQPLLANRTPNARVFSFDEDGFRYPWRRIAICRCETLPQRSPHSARDKCSVDVPASVIVEEMDWTSEAMFRIWPQSNGG